MTNIQINKEVKFNLKENIEAINKYMKDKNNFIESPPHQKDFFNFFTGKIHCGKCGKTFRLFHWCSNKELTKNILKL